MTTFNPQSYYRLAVATTFVLMLAAAGLIFSLGKDGSFLLINGWNTPWLDRVMPYVTWLGDGYIYIPILVLTFTMRRDFIWAIVGAIIICFLFTHTFKTYIFTNELRPFSLEAKGLIIHKVAGIELHTKNSFPSGHTSTAFTMALLLASLLKRKLHALLLPFVALAVGFSRIYLAQHFLTDVTAGMAIGIASSYLALLFHRYMTRRPADPNAAGTPEMQ